MRPSAVLAIVSYFLIGMIRPRRPEELNLGSKTLFTLHHVGLPSLLGLRTS